MRSSLIFWMVLCVFLSVSNWGCNSCSDEIVGDKSSPDGKLTASVFIRDCGATTSKEVTWVTVHQTSGFRDREKDIAMTADRIQTTELTWKDNSHLLVKCFACRRDNVHAQTTSIGAVSVDLSSTST